ncbi:VRR-NUC domain-containing protein [Bordetella genomosp. 1]|uniref:VRR-NUC domain-containing protein n=1 Tax=Bordetella genomosp. 1 TaxID=1395607 RepID=A0ABX4EW85_9BORD|nr:VRR-NUC domain-containing protein [Bordetella genomosp. 1]OZI58735.1 hypothetical protein CAL27_18815 [Bordetella genomosp. 1]
MRESAIESIAAALFKALGDGFYKFVSPARRSVPDRLRLRQVPPEHRALVGRYVHFIEFKAPGDKPTAAQVREHERLRALGYRVDVIDSVAGAQALAAEHQEQRA